MTESDTAETLEDFQDGEIEQNEISDEDATAFLRDLGINEEYREAGDTPIRSTKEVPEKFKDIQRQHDLVADKYETEGGKEIKAVKDEWGNFWSIAFTSGGQLPKELTGTFTDQHKAEQAIVIYLAKQEA